MDAASAHCVCCQKQITSKTILKYDSYSESLSLLYPSVSRDITVDGGGSVCLSCVNKAKSLAAKQHKLACVCCGGELAGHLYSYTNKKYHRVYKDLFPRSPLNNGNKVCQNCYVKARSKEKSDPSTLKPSKTSTPCPVCGENRTLIYSYFRNNDQYKEINPDSPLNNSPNVCDSCYRKAISIEQKSTSCACCRNMVGGTVLKYATNSDKYKILFPKSPLSDTNRVCVACYRRMRNEFLSKGIESSTNQESLRKRKRTSDDEMSEPFLNEFLVEVYCPKDEHPELYSHKGTLHVHMPEKYYRGEDIENLFAAKVAELLNSIDMDILRIEKLERSGPNSTIINNELYAFPRSTVFLVYIRTMEALT